MDSAIGLPPGFVLDQAPQAGPANGGGLPPGFVLDQPSAGMDIAKGAGTGLVQGLIGAAGMGGDIREMGVAGANKIANLLTGSDMSPGARTALDMAARAIPGVLSGPSSAEIKGVAGNVGVPVADYHPQTTAGSIAKSIGEFAPAAVSPGGIVRRGAQVVLPALASEGAGELTQGTAAEPYARAGAAVLGSIAAHRATAPGSPAPIKATSQDIVDAGSAAYKDPAVTGMTYKAGVVPSIADNTLSDLSRMKFNDRLAPQTRAVVEDMKAPVNGAAHTFEDYQTTREMLGKIAGNFANPTEQAAASQAINRLDKYFNGMKQSDLASGDLAQGMAKLQEGRRNYALGKLGQRVEEGINRAEVNTSSAHSGGNFDNATRQALKPFLLNPKKARGMSNADLEGIGDVVAGSATGNALRAGGKLLGGGGGLGAFLTALESAHALGPIGVAAPFVGYGLKKAGDAITRRNAQAIVQDIIARSPEGQRFAAMNARYAPAGAAVQGLLSNAALSALLSSASQRALLPYQQGVAVR